MRLFAAPLIVALAPALAACSGPAAPPALPVSPVAPLMLTVVATYPHDRGAFTEGLLLHQGKLYESTGMYGTSSVREVELESGRVLRHAEIENDQFGEGLALVGDRLFQLTYQAEIGWEWDLATFTRKRTFSYRGEGWGLTFDGVNLIQSDGSSRLTFRSPADFAIVKELQILRAGKPQFYINELEWVRGEIWANVWQSDEILRIDPVSGIVTGVVDASQLLLPEEREKTDVLNGIAWDPDRGLFLLTGKYWPKLFAVKITPIHDAVAH
ncbi:MAG: glutaminyl-peptide cyclotransferase [Thermoanaerobaculia bacterium]